MTVYEAVVLRLAMLGYEVTDNDKTGLEYLINKCEKDILANINWCREPESNNCIRFRFCAFFLKNRIKSKPLDVSRGFDDTTLKNFTTIFAIYS